MKKLILFINLTFAFGASFAGVKAPVSKTNLLPVKCVVNNKLHFIKFPSSQGFLTDKMELYQCSYDRFFPNSFVHETKKPSCLAYKANSINENFKKEQKNPKNYFESYFDISYFNKYLRYYVNYPNATCGDTGKKIKPTTITKIKRFHPIILEVEE